MVTCTATKWEQCGYLLCSLFTTMVTGGLYLDGNKGCDHEGHGTFTTIVTEA